jgi:antigen flippase
MFPATQASTVLPESLPPAGPVAKAEKDTYGQILTSTALVGGSSVINIAIGIVRTKVMAMLLGPVGFGLAGLYGSIANLSQSIAGMGINGSGVRQIAEAVGSNDRERMFRTAAVLRRTSIVLGGLGAVLLVVFSRQVSTLTFGHDRQAASVSLLSAAVLLNLVSAGQVALIQGLRHISDLAKISISAALLGTIITLPIVYFFRERGVVPSLVAVAAMSLITSWWYSRKVQIEIVPVTARQGGREAAALLKLGFAFMTSGLMTIGSAYFVRIAVLHRYGLGATGVYQAAWTLGGLYVGLILQAMGADFYPRLTASANDNAKCNRLVNEQTRVSLLLACPGILITLTFTPLVIALLYSSRFGAAVELLRWICLGTTFQVISWPMGFIIVAKSENRLFFISELAWTIVHLGLAWICLDRFGLNGAGIAFFGSYAFHVLLNYLIVRRLSGFRWSTENAQTGLILVPLIAVVFCGFYVLPWVWASCVGILASLVSCIYSVRVLLGLVSFERLPRPVQRLGAYFRSREGFLQ